jgi:transcriptional regulator with XRE-family HTH domain
MTAKRSSATIRKLDALAGGALSLGALLESIRLGEGIAQAAFATRLGISRSHLCDIEMGRKAVSPARAARFAEILGYSPDQFVRLSLQDQVHDAGLRLTVRVEAA